MRRGEPRIRLNARLVRERDRARARELRLFVLCGAAILVPLLLYVWQRVDFIRVSYRVEEMKKTRQALRETREQLTVERSFLVAPDRIEKEARLRLGMSEPPPDDVRRVRLIDGRLDGVGRQVRRDGGDGSGAAVALAGLATSAPESAP
jgi:cell division protein FtsL